MANPKSDKSNEYLSIEHALAYLEKADDFQVKRNPAFLLSFANLEYVVPQKKIT
jgi:hypothetical protein